jgi:hypothetical protein
VAKVLAWQHNLVVARDSGSECLLICRSWLLGRAAFVHE